MSADEIARTVADLREGTVDVVPVDRDWSEGYGETWDYVEAPSCPHCGDSARWFDVQDLLEIAHGLGSTEDIDRLVEVAHEKADDYSTWRCTDPLCGDFGVEIDPFDGGAEGPMMSYGYPLPDGISLDESDADKLRDLPLCIVRRDDGENYELALTGGGMNLSWEICHAFVLLDYLPPAHFAELPAMCGRADLSNTGNYGSPISDRDALIIAACRRTAEVLRERSNLRADRIVETLDQFYNGQPVTRGAS